MRTWRRILAHKVLQWGLAYSGAALAIAHGTTLLAEAYDWPRFVSRLVVTLLVVGLPLVLTLAWYHGHRHLQNFSVPELTIVSLLILIGGGLTLALVRGPATPAEGGHAAAPAARAPIKPASAPAVIASKPRLAILPFENLSPDPANAFFTDGLHEEVLTELANSSKALEVISRTTMMLYRSAPKPVEEIARELGATHVLEGSVRREGQDVRLTLQLIDARTDEHLWAQNFDRKLIKAMTLQSEVAKQVAEQLAVQLIRPDQQAQAATSDALAYDLYLKAHLAAQVLTVIDPIAVWRTAEAQFTQAIARDPNFARAYAERFDLRATMYFINIDTSDEAWNRMRADLNAAERLRPNDAEWLAYEAKWSALDQEYAHALALLEAAESAGYASSKLLQTRADVMGRSGLFPETLPMLDRAAALDPGNAFMLAYRGAVLAYVRRPAEAVRSLDLALERGGPNYALSGKFIRAQIQFSYTLDPEARRVAFPGPDLQLGDHEAEVRQAVAGAPELVPSGAWNLLIPAGVGPGPGRDLIEAEIDFGFGHREAAETSARKALDILARQPPTRHGGWFRELTVSNLKLYMGDSAGALSAARKAIALAPRSVDVVHWTIASESAIPVLAAAGRKDEALALIEQLTNAVPPLLPGDYAQNLVFARAFGDDARFRALTEKVRAQARATKLN